MRQIDHLYTVIGKTTGHHVRPVGYLDRLYVPCPIKLSKPTSIVGDGRYRNGGSRLLIRHHKTYHIIKHAQVRPMPSNHHVDSGPNHHPAAPFRVIVNHYSWHVVHRIVNPVRERRSRHGGHHLNVLRVDYLCHIRIAAPVRKFRQHVGVIPHRMLFASLSGEYRAGLDIPVEPEPERLFCKVVPAWFLFRAACGVLRVQQQQQATASVYVLHKSLPGLRIMYVQSPPNHDTGLCHLIRCYRTIGDLHHVSLGL